MIVVIYIKKSLICVLTVFFVLVIQVLFFLWLSSITNQLCLFNPWYLIFNNPLFYLGLAFVAQFFRSINDKLHAFLKTNNYKLLTKWSLRLMQIIAFFAYIYMSYYYGNIGAGACLKENINTNYYKYPDQEKYFNLNKPN